MQTQRHTPARTISTCTPTSSPTTTALPRLRTGGDTKRRQTRLNSTRVFWDPTYTDPNYPQPNYTTDANFTSNCTLPLQAPQRHSR